MKTIIVNGKSIELHAITGTVLSSNKHLETRVSSSGGGNNTSVSVTSRTIVHDQFFLQDSTGREHSFQLHGFDIACREGNTLSVILAIKDGKSQGLYVSVINHTTGKTSFNEDSLKRYATPNFWKLGGIFLAVAILGYIIGSGFCFVLVLLAFMGLLLL